MFFNYYILHICDFLFLFSFSSIFPYLLECSYFAYLNSILPVMLLQVVGDVCFVFFSGGGGGPIVCLSIHVPWEMATALFGNARW